MKMFIVGMALEVGFDEFVLMAKYEINLVSCERTRFRRL